jgi:methyl-accepting chemotaxis protein
MHAFLRILREWLLLARDRSIVRTAMRIALIAGTLLNVINQGPQIIHGAGMDWGKLLLTYLVPYVVSTISAVQTRRAG